MITDSTQEILNEEISVLNGAELLEHLERTQWITTKGKVATQYYPDDTRSLTYEFYCWIIECSSLSQPIRFIRRNTTDRRECLGA